MVPSSLQVTAIALAFLAFAGALWGLWNARNAYHAAVGLRSSILGHLDEQIAVVRREAKGIAEEVEQLLDRAKRERATATGLRGGRPRKVAGEGEELQTGDNGAGWTIERYRDHLERGGRRIPQVEQGLGL